MGNVPVALYERVLKGVPKEHRALLLSADDSDLDNHPDLEPKDKGILKSKRRDLRKVLTDEGWAKMEAVETLDRVLEMTERVLNPAAHGAVIPLYEDEVHRATRLIERLEKVLETSK